MIEIPIIYEDESIVAVNKPAGLLVHGDGRVNEETLTDWIRARYPEAAGVGEPARYGEQVIDRPGIVHRLDRDTSGVLIIAKTHEMFVWLKRQFQERAVQKTYRALVYGSVPQDERGAGVIDAPIGRSKRDFKMWAAGDAARGKIREAHTEYRVLAEGEGVSYVEVYPKTGRTHQIRVHFASIGHPVVGDKLYAKKRVALFGLTRHALHALSISFPLPSGAGLLLEAPLPEDIKNTVAALRCV